MSIFIDYLVRFINTAAYSITAFFTALTFCAILVSALIAYFTIKENRNIEKERINIQRKSLAKNLLFEVRDNNWALDYLQEKILENEGEIEKKVELGPPPLIFTFFKKTSYKNFVNKYLNIDFNEEKIGPNLREYYGDITLIEKTVKLYNEACIKKNKVHALIDRVISHTGIQRIKSQLLDENLLKMLEIEAEFDLREKGFMGYNPFTKFKINE